MESIEVKYHQVLAALAHRENVILTLQAELDQHKLLQAQVALEQQICDLPLESRERLRRAFPGTDLNGLRSAVRVEKRYTRGAR